LTVDVCNDFFWFRLIKLFRKLRIACLANSEIAKAIIVNSIVTNSSAYSANIAYVVNVCYPLKVEMMSNWAPFFGARRNSTTYTVKFLANSAKRAAKLLLLALSA
jgi:hypothetical protein